MGGEERLQGQREKLRAIHKDPRRRQQSLLQGIQRRRPIRVTGNLPCDTVFADIKGMGASSIELPQVSLDKPRRKTGRNEKIKVETARQSPSIGYADADETNK